VGRGKQKTQHDQVSHYYFGYLDDAVSKFESAITRLKQCDYSRCDISDATDMAHRIKGNAAMYGYPDLGLKAANLETLLRADKTTSDHANIILQIFIFIDDIQQVCQGLGNAEPTGLNGTLAAEEEEKSEVSQSTQPSFGRKNIIIAYQDFWVCDLMASLLEPEFSVISCHTEEELFSKLKIGSADLLILENSFGKIGGLSLLKQIKMSRAIRTLPIFMAFDNNASEAIAEAIGLGVDGFLEDKHEILDIVNSARNFINKPKKCILVVDDDPVVQQLLKQSLSSAGLSVDTVEDGLEALNYLSKKTPDLVLLDRFMPRLEGGTVLYEIQSKINLKSIPVLILTSMVNQGEAKSWFERGAADFIPKPFDPEEVVMRVKQHLDIRYDAA